MARPNPDLTLKTQRAFAEGRFAACLKAARAAIKANGAQPVLLTLAGLSCANLGQHSEALRFFTQLVKTSPNDPAARQNRIQALLSTGDTKRALTEVEAALARWPDMPAMLRLRINACLAAKDLAAARTAVDAAISVTPQDAVLHGLRARIALDNRDNAAALDSLETAVTLAPNNPDLRLQYAEYLLEHANPDQAGHQIETGLQAFPDHIGLCLLQARLYGAIGQPQMASTAYARILAQVPTHPIALNGMAYTADAQAAALLLEPLKSAADAEKRGSPLHILLTFALARAERTVGAPEAAKTLASGNRLAARAMPYDAKAEVAEHREILDLTDAMTPVTASPDGPVPVFVVGLIRSGTSLCEQVMAAHPQVTGFGELTQMGNAVRSALRDDTQAHDLAATYLSALPALPTDAAAFVDKMPENFRFIGPILRAFPNAVVIEMQRDPRDVALSMWDSLFPTTAHAYANDFAWMAQHMNHYARVMADWRAAFGDRIHAMRYSELVTDLDGTSHRLAELCNVPWDSAMLNPQDVNRPVLTASSQQVRAPVHTRSLGRWQGHTQQLAPLLAGLDRTLWPEL